MKNRFVKITLILTMLLVVAVPTQSFAAEKNCSLNQSNTLNTQTSKIYSQLPQATLNKLREPFAQYCNGNLDADHFRSFQQFGQKAPAARAQLETPQPSKASCNNTGKASCDTTG
jgi:hypothetical protein